MSLYLAVDLSSTVQKQIRVYQNFLRQKFDGDYEDETRFHITVRWLTDDTTHIDKVIEGLMLYEQTYNPKKFNVTAKGFYQFDNEKPVVWMGVHNTKPLYDAKYQIEDCFRKIGYTLPQESHQGYTPHITLAYNVKIPQDFVYNFNDGINFTVDNINFWNSFKANNTYVKNSLYKVDFK